MNAPADGAVANSGETTAAGAGHGLGSGFGTAGIVCTPATAPFPPHPRAADLARLLVDPSAPWPDSPAGWEALLAVARRAMLLATLADRWQSFDRLAEVPPQPRLHLEAAQRVALRLAHEVRAEIGRIHEALAPRGHRVLLLKGAAYLAAGLPPARGRLFVDVDLLAPRSDMAAVERSLFGAGWLPAETDAYNQRYYREWMHEVPPLRHALRASTLDLHHTVTPPTSRFGVDGARLWQQAVPVWPDAALTEAWPGATVAAAKPQAPEAPVWILSPVDMVLHSAVHLFTEGEFEHGLRDLWDLHALLSHFSAEQTDFWPALLQRAQDLGLTLPLHHALWHTGRLFGTRPPADSTDAVRALAPDDWPRRGMARLLAIALEPSPASERGVAEAAARWLLYVRSHWLRMPLRLLLPHLLRKAWMRRFPDPAAAPQPQADAAINRPTHPTPPR